MSIVCLEVKLRYELLLWKELASKRLITYLALRESGTGCWEDRLGTEFAIMVSNALEEMLLCISLFDYANNRKHMRRRT